MDQLRTGIAVVLLSIATLPCLGQQAKVSNTLMVSANGTAQAPADWVRLGIELSGSDESAVGAMIGLRDSYDQAIGELTQIGIEATDISMDAPRFSNMSFRRRGNEGPARQWRANSTLRVRLRQVKPDTVYDRIGEVLDTVGGEAPEIEQMRGFLRMAGGGQSPEQIVFGLDDPGPVEEQAIADALTQASRIAKIAAAQSSNKLGPLVSLRVAGISSNAPVRQAEQPGRVRIKPAHALVAASIVATFALQ